MWQTCYKISLERLPHMPEILKQMRLAANGTITLRIAWLGISLYSYWGGFAGHGKVTPSKGQENNLQKAIYTSLSVWQREQPTSR